MEGRVYVEKIPEENNRVGNVREIEHVEEKSSCEKPLHYNRV